MAEIKKNILIFLGSARLGRMGERVAKYVEKAVSDRGMEPILFDPVEMPFEVVRQPLHFMKNPETEAPDWMREANEKIKNADGFIMVSAEYNCAIPPALTNMLDHFPPTSYRHRPCALITYSMGSFGGVRAGTILRPFASELGMVTIPSWVAVPTVQDIFDEQGASKSERVAKNIEKLLCELGWYVDALGNHMKATSTPEGTLG